MARIFPRSETESLFLAGLLSGMRPPQAAKALNVGRSTIYRWRQEQPAFAAAWASMRELRLREIMATRWVKRGVDPDAAMRMAGLTIDFAASVLPAQPSQGARGGTTDGHPVGDSARAA
jgi:hypothetical protein